jgi:hypothetical protein
MFHVKHSRGLYKPSRMFYVENLSLTALKAEIKANKCTGGIFNV